DHEAGLGEQRRDVARRHRAVELAAFRRLAHHHEALAVELGRYFFRLAPLSKVARLEVGLHRLEARAVLLGGAERLAFGEQEIAGVTVLDTDDVTHLAEPADALQQDHFHFSTPYEDRVEFARLRAIRPR